MNDPRESRVIEGDATVVEDAAHALPDLLVNLQIARPGDLVAIDPVSDAQSLDIDCPEMAVIGNEDMQDKKRLRNAIEAKRKELVAPIDAARASVQEFFRPFLDAFDTAEGIYKEKLLAWKKKEDARIAEEQRKAREAVEAERRRQAEAEAAARAKADQEAAELRERAAAAAAEGNAVQAAKLEARAEEKVIQGEAKAQEIAVQRAATAAVVAPPPVAAKLKGTGVRDNWKAIAPPEKKGEILAFIAANPQYHHLVEFNPSALNQMAKALKDMLPTTIPGLLVTNDQTITTRTR